MWFCLFPWSGGHDSFACFRGHGSYEKPSTPGLLLLSLLGTGLKCDLEVILWVTDMLHPAGERYIGIAYGTTSQLVCTGLN